MALPRVASVSLKFEKDVTIENVFRILNESGIEIPDKMNDSNVHTTEGKKVAPLELQTGKLEIKDDVTDVKREQWGARREFLLACVGSAVGLGNAWRYPYLCYENGGGAFLIPYIIMVFTCAVPLFFMEISLGQFSSQGPITVWNFCPLFKGVGIGAVIITTILFVYYNVIIAWSVYFMIKSLSFPTLPWTTCDNEWNTEYCFDDRFNTTQKFGRGEDSVRASEEFWIHGVHQLPSSIGEIGGFNWHLLACLIVCWIVSYGCVAKGVKSLGKVVYFTALFPYIILTILFFRGITLPGAWEGIKIYIVPKFEDLIAIKPWRDAAVQIFFSLGISLGTKLTLASYNDFHNNCYRDALYVVMINCGTSVFAGFATFAIIGFMAQDSNQALEDVVQSGTGLAFIAYPEALARMPGPQFWSLLFFIMLFTLGLDSEFILIETIVTATMDFLPQKWRKWKPQMTILVCVLGFLLSIIMVTKGGLYYFVLVDWYCAKFSATIFAIIFTLALSYIYGFKRFSNDVKRMIGYEPNLYWRACLSAISPMILFLISISNFVFFSPAKYGDYIFPFSAQIVGWMISLTSFFAVPAYMIYAVIFKAKFGSVWQRLLHLTKPSSEWGPRLTINRQDAGCQVEVDRNI